MDEMEPIDHIKIRMPVIETERLIIRPFRLEDLEDIHHILDHEVGDSLSLEERGGWLHWSAASVVQMARMYQPPFGDRAVVLKTNNRLIGACGYAPALVPLCLLPSFKSEGDTPETALTEMEVGLYCAFSPYYRGHGYATEAVRALVDYAFHSLRLRRIVATTTYDNEASQRVMHRLGMRVEKNCFSSPFWFQVLGILENPNRGGQ